MKVGILGGTFDPIHNGHIAMALAAYEQLSLDLVLIMPSGIPPHKKSVLSSNDRLNMIRLAVKDYSFMQVSDYEIVREGTTYTADTLTMLTEANPDNEYVFIVGADSLVYMSKWYKPDVIFRLASIAVCSRQDTLDESLLAEIKRLKEEYLARIDLLEFEHIDISSSYIRECFCKNDYKGCIAFMSDKVVKYIVDNQLYRC